MQVKICGVTSRAASIDAINAGANMIGLVFFARSPRNLDIATAREIALDAPVGVLKVGLFVDPDDALLDVVTAKVPLDMIQLHGHEPPARVAEIKARYGLPILKAIGVAAREDIHQVLNYAAADMFLLDAKAPKEAAMPGGNGAPFDWSLLRGIRLTKPWMLAGGLNPDNVAEAVAISGTPAVDVSSGVESAPGIKDKNRVEAFIAAAKGRK